MPKGYNTNFATNPYYLWSQLMYNIGTEEFLNTINYGYGCAITDDIELIECISAEFEDFAGKYGIDLTANEQNVIKKALVKSSKCGEELFSFLNEIQNTEYIDCEQGESSDQIKIDALISVAKSGQLEISDLEQALANYDWIKTQFTDERIECVYNKLMNDENGIWCATFKNFTGDSPDNLWIQNHSDVFGYAQTTNFSHLGYIQIMFNQNQMSDHCEITIMGAFLHEGIHAEMFGQLNNPDIDPNALPLIWDTYDSTTSHHDNMSEMYINNLIIALRSIYGNTYTDLEYEAIAWHGLGNINGEEVFTSAWLNLPESKKLELTNVFQELNSNCDEDECK